MRSRSIGDLVHAIARRRARWETQRFVKREMYDVISVRHGGEVLDWALREIAKSPAIQGMYLEFGVGMGGSLRKIAKHHYVYGFDSFKGLPENWRYKFPAGYFKLDETELQQIESVQNSELVIGLFEDTLREFIGQRDASDRAISFAHIDCDLHDSTATVLNHIGPFLEPGAIVLFDEYFNYPGWKGGEHRALLEWKLGPDWEYACYASEGEQVAIRVH
jgi:hypothetical protein